MSECENRAADRNGCMGLLFVGLNPPKPGLEELGMLTGVELSSKPAEDANPTEMEFETVGESASNSRSKAPVRFKESSKFSSSKALPRENTQMLNFAGLLLCYIFGFKKHKAIYLLFLNI